jgi:hypothetical protein
VETWKPVAQRSWKICALKLENGTSAHLENRKLENPVAPCLENGKSEPNGAAQLENLRTETGKSGNSDLELVHVRDASMDRASGPACVAQALWWLRPQSPRGNSSLRSNDSFDRLKSHASSTVRDGATNLVEALRCDRRCEWNPIPWR